MPIPSPLHNVRHELVHFQPRALFSLHFPQATLNGGRGLQKNPEYVIKSELKDETLYCPNEFVHDCSSKEIVCTTSILVRGLPQKWGSIALNGTTCRM